jgi:hypothetical protein
MIDRIGEIKNKIGHALIANVRRIATQIPVDDVCLVGSRVSVFSLRGFRSLPFALCEASE